MALILIQMDKDRWMLFLYNGNNIIEYLYYYADNEILCKEGERGDYEQEKKS